MVRQRAGRTSLWMLQFLPCRCSPKKRHNVENVDSAGARPATGTILFRSVVKSVDTMASNSVGRPRACAGASPAAATSFGEWRSVYARVSETRGRKPMQVRILSRRPIFSSAPCPLTSPGDPPLKRAMQVQVHSRRQIFQVVMFRATSPDKRVVAGSNPACSSSVEQ